MELKINQDTSGGEGVKFEDFARSFQGLKNILKIYFLCVSTTKSEAVPKKSAAENAFPQELVRNKEFLRNFFYYAGI